MVTRRQTLKLLGTGVATPLLGRGVVGQPRSHFRFGITDVFLHDQAVRLLRDFLEGGMHMPVQIIQKASYQEALEALRSDEMEAGWICGYPYVVAQRFVRLCAQPGWRGLPWYRSYLITGVQRRTPHRLQDLQGDVFAFSDPLSNSGFLVPVVALRGIDQTPQSFFRSTFYTYSLHKVVDAVASGLAQSGTVDGYIWEILRKKAYPSARKTRIVARSRQYGFPPIVTRNSLDVALHLRLQKTLIDAQNGVRGRELLRALDLQRFLRPDPAWFQGIRILTEVLDGRHPPLPIDAIYDVA